MNSPVRKKIAVLGGGVGAMTAAFELTQEPNWQDKYEITVYQLGWRLGGKGASGRDPEQGDRILEHGLHVWGGYYDNAFRVMRDCYDAAQRPPSVPIRSVEDAFLGVNQVFLSDFVDDHPHFWRVDFPPNDEKPGQGGVFLSPRDYLIELIEGLKDLISRFPVGAPSGLASLLLALPDDLRAHVQHLQPEQLSSHAHVASAVTKALPLSGSVSPIHRLLQWLMVEFLEHLGRRTDAGSLNPTLASVLAALEIGAASVKGMIADRVLTHGFDAIDDEEWSAWVIRHGASKRAMESATGRCSYDYVFGSRAGITDFGHRAVAAGTAMRALLRLLFTYKGALFYKLNAGMGDIVFAPMWEVLSQRGVRFRFFHKVTHLGLSADGRQIETVHVNRQVRLKAGEDAAYQPLFDVGGLPCWPERPFYDQLVEGEVLQREKINLESMWSGWPGEDLPPLQRGRDFDLVVLGIALGGLPAIAKELSDRLPPWQAMFDHIKTVATQAMQFWFTGDLASLGWPSPSGILTGYYEPMDTWSDMSFLLPRENWGPVAPKQISYFCTVFKPTEAPPPFGRNDYPQRQRDAVKAQALPWVNQRLTQLMPKTEGPGGGFDFGLLFDKDNGQGLARYDAQFFRVNVDPPSELYVQSVPGSTRYRMTADGSGVDNLFLAGDWLRTGINAGCVEAAAMGGLQAARAISGRHIPIVGESDLADSPLAAQNAQLPWSLVYAQGQISAAVLTLALPTADVERMLPPGVNLLPQTVTPAGTHPVGLIFADQSQVRANVLPLGMAYKESAVAIPFTTVSTTPAADAVPLLTLPALYLDSVMATLAGRLMYGYRKHLARVSGSPAQQQVHTLLGNQAILSAQLHVDGLAGSYYDFEHLAVVREMMNQPIVTHDPLRGWLYSFLDYQFEQARITPLRGQLAVAAGVLGHAAAQTLPVASLAATAVGAFQFDGAWTLTNPLESNALKEQIDQMRQQGQPRPA